MYTDDGKPIRRIISNVIHYDNTTSNSNNTCNSTYSTGVLRNLRRYKMAKYDVRLYIKWGVQESYCLNEYVNVSHSELKGIEDYMNAIIYDGLAVDAQLEYSIHFEEVT